MFHIVLENNMHIRSGQSLQLRTTYQGTMEQESIYGDEVLHVELRIDFTWLLKEAIFLLVVADKLEVIAMATNFSMLTECLIILALSREALSPFFGWFRESWSEIMFRKCYVWYNQKRVPIYEQFSIKCQFNERVVFWSLIGFEKWRSWLWTIMKPRTKVFKFQAVTSDWNWKKSCKLWALHTYSKKYYRLCPFQFTKMMKCIHVLNRLWFDDKNFQINILDFDVSILDHYDKTLENFVLLYSFELKEKTYSVLIFQRQLQVVSMEFFCLVWKIIFSN